MTGAKLQTAENLSRLGTESAFEVLARAEALKAEGHDVINLGIGQPDFSTPEHIVEAAVKALRDGHHGYTPAPGILPLREAVAADILRLRGVEVDPNNIVCVPGGKVTMFFAIMMFGEAGAEIMYPNPGFPIYESAINYSGAKAVPIPLLEENDFSFDADEVLSLITPATRMIIINTPANPTGGAVPKAEMDKLAAGLEKHPHVAILSDEIYGQMTYDGHEHVSLLSYEHLRDRLILLDGWSKTYAMTGWRLGYALWPESLVDAATRLAINCHSCVNAGTQFAGIAALEGPQDSVHEMVRAFDERRHVIVEELNAIKGFSCRTPMGAFYAFPNISGTGQSAREVQDKLLSDAYVATVAGTSFGHLGENYVRFSYANSVENIQAALERVREIYN
ncbi:MAG: pyridoxal phosphate-dependent aminotransferase [Rhodospirillaceae bacterium]|jgi:aspartate/methionine/tyrosine aminotransferase|nr:pyridoxal phosphate-dependent aminotransferase [Rhodospirillaceae bacterium]MBT3809343.1 pyridoxal phosphate-dependent aminotransferase [Rhodospirillaceae bacterium]MBT4770976.1 pyridoxal phosphate-dependent aminotransferase [Rhodospirillaceae bacterium]MBT5359229.1 pyridoxal phosphate-dependent aminotransferase [Rhodospirillaceae bacterium]MBT5769099.1 pyridoxal phosphate-dependent aminotransferase [Rhodospirillaceae bacterium]